jgi:hypothetical protein
MKMEVAEGEELKDQEVRIVEVGGHKVSYLTTSVMGATLGQAQLTDYLKSNI